MPLNRHLLIYLEENISSIKVDANIATFKKEKGLNRLTNLLHVAFQNVLFFLLL